MTEAAAREAICSTAASLYPRGYVHATGRNISLRLDDDSLLITPTDACLGTLDPARLAHLDAQGRQISGDRASKTGALHQQLVAAARAFDTQTRCVIHTHSTHCVARSMAVENAAEGAAELLPPITPYFVMEMGHVPLLPYHRPGDPALAALAGATVTQWGQRGTPIRALMLARLRPNVWRDSVQAAAAVLEELEETAKLAMLLHGAPAPLDAAALAELCQHFGTRW